MNYDVVIVVHNCAVGLPILTVVPVASASGRQHLRSASRDLLQVPTARTMIGRRSFAVEGPYL